MENMNIYSDGIHMRACCNTMCSPRCILCLKRGYMPFNYDENINFTIVPVDEIEE